MIRLFDTPAAAQGNWSRRDLLQAGVLGVGGLALSNMLQLESVRRAVAARVQRPARNCIFMFLNGGQAQMDTFDMKPAAPDGIRGPYHPIATSVPGTQISSMLPRLSRLTKQYTILRSASHPLSGHNSSAAYVLSGHTPGNDSSIQPTPMDHPTYGSVVSRIHPAPNHLPSSVLTPRLLFDMGFPTPSAGGGWLGRQYDPFPVVRNRMMSKAPAWSGTLPGPRSLALPSDISHSRLASRRSLLGHVDTAFTAARDNASARTLQAHQDKALNLILSPQCQAAFDLSKESAATHDRYGRFEMGQVLLMARRLVESGVRFVTANAVSNPKNTRLSSFQIWDTHFDHFRLYNETLLPEFDQSLSALLEDLQTRGLLSETLVIVMGEMGRTPTINKNKDGGRDHWGRAYSVLWAGGGVNSGHVIGATDKNAGEVIDAKASPDDIAATLYEALGIPHETVLEDIAGRPRRITDGSPVEGLLA
ncbi:MAG: DUF1501 domain-containing protein [Planctomycetota bacterium]|nr:DUF1501 domain-containing protein [Planctomycetota bacterium]